jgi:hypothetical protein
MPSAIDPVGAAMEYSASLPKVLALVWISILVALTSLGPASAAGPVPHLEHVVLIVLEDKNYDEVRTLPYISSLIATGAVFTNSHGVAHPSQPNYLALWSGSQQGVTDNTCPAPGSPFSTENLGHACQAAGYLWRSYVESLPSTASLVCSANGGLYTRDHNPCTNFDNLNDQDNRPYTDLARDLGRGHYDEFIYAAPNNCNNSRDCPASTSDTWLANNVPWIMGYMGPNDLLIITWDEDLSADNHILTIFLGGPVKPGYASSRAINHYTVLRTICDGLGLAPFGAAASESPIVDAWIGAASRDDTPLPDRVELSQNRPNPFSRSTRLSFYLPREERVRLEVLDVRGAIVATLIDGRRPAGTNTIAYEAAKVPSGIYFFALQVGSQRLVRRAALLGR